MNRNILLAIPLLMVFTAVTAQDRILLTGTKTKQDTQIAVDNFRVEQTEQKTIVTMDFVLDSMTVKSARYRAFTPILRAKDGSPQQRLKSLLVTGRIQDVIFERDGIDPLYADNYQTVRREKDEPQRVAYTDIIDTDLWHKGAEVWLECDLCGCGDIKKSEMALLGRLKSDPVFYYANAIPAPESTGAFGKVRDLHGTAYINFVVDRWEMRPDYMDNRRELRKITDTLDVMTKDPNIFVDKIKIHGWASPESPYEHNRMLAINRAQSLTDYVRLTYNLPDSVFAAPEATPENWIGLREAVEQTSLDVLPHRAEILALIDDNTLEPDPKEWRIKTKYPQEYQYLLHNVYPHLRRSDYEITFEYKVFTLDEAKEVYKTKPYQLSVRELWDVANTFESGSDDYNRAIQTAVNLYPDNAEAAVNLANIALQQNDLLKAETLLQHAGNSGEAENARAVLYMKQGKLDKAEAALNRAEAKGIDVTGNRQTLQEMK